MHSVNRLPDPCFPLFFGCQEAQSQISGSLHANVQDFNACALRYPPRGFTWVSHPSFPGAWMSCLFFPQTLLYWMTLDLKTRRALDK